VAVAPGWPAAAFAVARLVRRLHHHDRRDGEHADGDPQKQRDDLQEHARALLIPPPC
jgi:hypothetical protein